MANLIVNPDFNNNAQNYCSKDWCLVTDSAAISPWTLASGPAFELDSSKLWKPYSGGWSMDLCGDVGYSIQQLVTLEVNAGYMLTLMIGANGNVEKTGFVSVTDGPNQTFTHEPSDPIWKQILYPFTATSKQSAITIGSNMPGSACTVLGYVNLIKTSNTTSITTSVTTATPVATAIVAATSNGINTGMYVGMGFAIGVGFILLSLALFLFLSYSRKKTLKSPDDYSSAGQETPIQSSNPLGGQNMYRNSSIIDYQYHPEPKIFVFENAPNADLPDSQPPIINSTNGELPVLNSTSQNNNRHIPDNLQPPLLNRK
ncbi:hypothetical protein HDV06_001689 [Boothiomyces sp. JEL0866]|nr:hypothetical protein HDV06_001689 [Boothiomyces sp. JEL0866]